ncbi:hypothetical protein B0H17DRAFT_1195545 [Mycena rosella]|uniref:WD40 repeat-like protein n=1 Tax=Mycena rosella TaxID=1033263 RepID=A0AAD7GQR7_MYCRO|nr:hypothetical protein B0H17DRAFT_1195545 [Mycena rosella]
MRWKIAKCLIRIIFDGHQQEINSLEFSFDNRLIISGSGDRTVRIWYTLRVLSITPDPEPLSAPSNPPINADAGVTSIAIPPDGAVTASCVDAVIWSVAMGALGELLHGHPDSVYSVHWDLRGGTARKEGGKASVCTTNLLWYEQDTQWVLLGSKDCGMQFWDADGIVQSVVCVRAPPRGDRHETTVPGAVEDMDYVIVRTVITLSPAKCMDDPSTDTGTIAKYQPICNSDTKTIPKSAVICDLDTETVVNFFPDQCNQICFTPSQTPRLLSNNFSLVLGFVDSRLWLESMSNFYLNARVMQVY